ncbi:MAG: hypothetical protein IJU23_12660 [Proteobacteria bacterium]|nr:hypothetical protein [Pseudomonadota bacterium]
MSHMKKGKTQLIFLLTAVVAFIASYFCCKQTSLTVPKSMGADEYSVLPNKNALVWMSLGQREFLADLIWIRALQYNNLKNEAHLAENFADAMIELDPQFKAAYRWAAIMAVFTDNITEQSVKKANEYLALGAKQFPLDPYYDYSIAINDVSYYPASTPEIEAERRSDAVTHLQLAMQKPGADKDIPLLISGLLNDDEVSVKVHFLQQAMLTENDPETKKNLQTRLIVLSESAGSSALLLAAKREQWHREHHEYLPIMLDFLISADNP